MKKYSRQRELILTSLQNRSDHPTAEKLYIDVKETMPEIGIATVYRNLAELCEQGEINKIKSKIGPDRFDAKTIPHIHFHCESCQEIFDIFLQEQEIKKQDNELAMFANKIEGKAVSSEITIKGVCKVCKEKN